MTKEVKMGKNRTGMDMSPQDSKELALAAEARHVTTVKSWLERLTLAEASLLPTP